MNTKGANGVGDHATVNNKPVRNAKKNLFMGLLRKVMDLFLHLNDDATIHTGI